MSVLDALHSAFTQPATAAKAPSQVFGDRDFQNNTYQKYGFGNGGDNPFVNTAKGVQAGITPGIFEGAQFANGLEGKREQAYNSLFNELTPGALTADATRQKNAISQNSTNAARQTGLTLQGLGYGEGAAGGAAAGVLGQGARQASQVDEFYNNPLNRMAIYNASIQAANGGMQNPLLNQAEGLEGPIVNQNQTNFNQRGQGLLGQVAPIIGGLTGQGGGFSSLFGGGGNGGGYTSDPNQGNFNYPPNPYAYGPGIVSGFGSFR